MSKFNEIFAIQESLDCLYPNDLVTIQRTKSHGPRTHTVNFQLYNMADGDRQFSGVVTVDTDEVCTWTEIEPT